MVMVIVMVIVMVMVMRPIGSRNLIGWVGRQLRSREWGES
jgi:hypothetical protein